MNEANGRKRGKEPSSQPASPADLPTIDGSLLEFEGIGADNIDKSNRDMPPRLTILQATSPQLKKQNENYLSDAQAGDFCNVVTGDSWREQVTVIPCEYVIHYIEWGKDRSGLVKNYGPDASILHQCVRTGNQYALPDGDPVEQTAV